MNNVISVNHVIPVWTVWTNPSMKEIKNRAKIARFANRVRDAKRAMPTNAQNSMNAKIADTVCASTNTVQTTLFFPSVKLAEPAKSALSRLAAFLSNGNLPKNLSKNAQNAKSSVKNVNYARNVLLTLKHLDAKVIFVETVNIALDVRHVCSENVDSENSAKTVQCVFHAIKTQLWKFANTVAQCVIIVLDLSAVSMDKEL